MRVGSLPLSAKLSPAKQAGIGGLLAHGREELAGGGCLPAEPAMARGEHAASAWGKGPAGACSCPEFHPNSRRRAGDSGTGEREPT